jgi:hypothetical protein
MCYARPGGLPLTSVPADGCIEGTGLFKCPTLCPHSPVPRAKTTCRVCRRPGICHVKWTFNLVFIDLHNLRDKSQADSGRGMRL